MNTFTQIFFYKIKISKCLVISIIINSRLDPIIRGKAGKPNGGNTTSFKNTFIYNFKIGIFSSFARGSVMTI
jgi:hypothetical protein